MVDEEWHGTGPWLITITEAAELLRVDEQAVAEWIAAGQLKAVTFSDGEHRLRIADEQRFDDGTSDSTYSFRSGMYVLDFWPEDWDEHAHARWGEQLAQKQREKRLEGVDPGSIDVAALARELANRLSDALPPGWTATGTEGIVTVLDADGIVGSSVDMALIIGDERDTDEDRVRGAVVSALDAIQSDLAEETTEPWPDHAGKTYAGLPEPGVEILGGELRAWYGVTEALVVAFSPISLDAVLREDG